MKIDTSASIVSEGHQDFPLLSTIADFLIARLNSKQDLIETVGVIIRASIDSVIDTPRTSRRGIDDLEKTEKTYLGTRVEILLRHKLGVQKGELDLDINGIDTDVKFTVRDNWMIPREAYGSPCILIGADESTGKFCMGLFIAHEQYLNEGSNQDRKRTISKSLFKNIYWITANEPYPRRFWQVLDATRIQEIFSGKTGTERVVRLFDEVRNIPINRSVVADVAQQSDYMKRIRKNGGARDALKKKGVLLLSGKYNSPEIASRGLPTCDKESFISTEEYPINKRL
jgi:hypothetical protein